MTIGVVPPATWDWIPSQVIAMPQLFWPLAAFAALVMIFFGWLLARYVFERNTLEDVRCPLRGVEASVVFRRSLLGSRVDVMRCSLLSPSHRIGCGKKCLRSAA
jgi:hypothetical protein